MKILILILLSLAISLQRKAENFAIILSTSKFWFNFRQATNTMMIYQTLRENGIPDENILYLLPENTACNPRNPQPGIVSPFDGSTTPNLFRDIEIDYKHSDVNVKGFFNILRGRYSKYLPQGQRIKMSKNSNILVYFTGHGGDSYIKMQDTDVVFDEDLERILRESYNKNLYNEIAMFSDSCSAATLFYKLVAPNIFAVGSSSFDEKSYSYGRDSVLKMSKTDRFSINNYKYMHHEFKANPNLKFADIFKTYTEDYLKGHYETINTMPTKTANDIYLKEFWTNQRLQQVSKANIQKSMEQRKDEDINNINDEVLKFNSYQSLNDEISKIHFTDNINLDLSLIVQ